MADERPRLPVSATSDRVAVAGIVAVVLSLAWLLSRPALDPAGAALTMMAAYLLPVAILEIAARRVHLRDSTGLDWSLRRPVDPRRVAVKIIGMASILGAVAAIHALFRFYGIERMRFVGDTVLAWLPEIACLTVAYVVLIDRKMRHPEDGYWQVGALLTGLERRPDWTMLRPFLLGWTIKGFFLPIMFVYLAGNLLTLHDNRDLLIGGPVELTRGLLLAAVILELSIVCVGYTMTLRLFDAHIRSPNPFLLGWLVTLACYEPFNRVVSGGIVKYRTDREWHEVIADYPLLVWPWIAALLVSFFVWVWATAIYGLRWSNLTHRGIVTGGPYRFTKHPDYVAKSIFFWLTAAPFLTAVDTTSAIAATAALVVVNGIYFGRARMEERHLSEDPAYVAYALAMNERSIFRWLTRLVPALAYGPPRRAAGDPAMTPAE